ncbi:uncharacterized protein VNE69_02185 [Vairimorpha necatrix]|uniref:Uncharacterized protein n=1 Tax=Vairimorpha necatrix TaxID=6039 RepID=A0AAX4J9J8_9MICR
MSNRVENKENGDIIKLKEKGFQVLVDEDKIEKILDRADDGIFEAHLYITKNKKSRKIVYVDWKDYMLAKFENKISKRDFYKEHQRKDEKCFEFFRRMKKLGDTIIEDQQLIFLISFLGLRKMRKEIVKATVSFIVINDDFLEIVKRLEEIRNTAVFRKNSKKSLMEGKFKKEVNNIENVEEIIKDNYVHLKNNKFRTIFDTGLELSFITFKISKKVKEQIF